MKILENSSNPIKSNKALISGILALLILAVMIITSPTGLRYDEPYHLSVAKNIINTSWYKALMDPLNPSAAGPLFAAVHVAFYPITGLEAPAVRWVNFFLLLITIVVISRTAQTPSGIHWGAGLSILSVPFIWPCVGMALTEIPALLAFSVYIYCFLRVLRRESPDSSIFMSSSYIWAASAGLALGVAILGRQTYLVVLPGVFLVSFFKPRFWRFSAITLLTALLTCLWLFIQWNGLLPPSIQNVNSGMRWQNLMLALSYITAATILIRPRWIKFQNHYIIFASVMFGFILTWISRDYNTPPAKGLLLRILGQDMGLLLGFIGGSAFGSIAILWTIETVRNAWRERSDLSRFFLYVTLFTLIIAPVKVSFQFSSRYLVGSIGVLTLILYSPKSEVFSLPRFLTGCLLGAITLSTYYSGN